VQDPLSETDSDLSPYNYVANNPVNFIDPYGLYRAKNPRESGGSGNPASDWPFQGDDLEPPFGFGRNNFGRYYPGNFPDPGSGFGDLYVQGVDGKYYRWSDIAKDITIYTGSSYYLGGILESALSGGIAGIEAFVEDYWTGFYDLLANSSSLGEYGSGYGMMFDGDPKKKNDVNRWYNLSKSDIEGLIGASVGFSVLAAAASADLPIILIGAKAGSTILSTVVLLDTYWDWQENPTRANEARFYGQLLNTYLTNKIRWYFVFGTYYSIRDIEGANDKYYKRFEK